MPRVGVENLDLCYSVAVKLLTAPKEFTKLKRLELAKLQCFHCNEIFLLEKFRVQRAIERSTGKFCSQACARRSSRTSQEVNCANCSTLFRKQSVELQRTVNHFCSRSCAAQYNNRHKNLGATRRSKAED